MPLKSKDMAMHQTFFRRAKSIAGTLLAGLGILVFYENLHQAANHLSHLLGTIPAEAPGESPSLALLQVLQVYAADHQHFSQVLLLHTVASFWPLLLVLVGTVLSRDNFTDDVNAHPKKDC